jgi:hypothetical protein
MIVTFQDIRKVRPIAENMVDEKRLLPYMKEVEELHLIPTLGASLYKQIDDSPSDFLTALDGGYYNNDQCYSAGLKQAFGYLVYSRFLYNQGLNVTAFGAVSKTTQFSDPADEATIVRAANEARKIGLEYLSQSVAYLKFIGAIDCCKQPIKRNTKFLTIGD